MRWLSYWLHRLLGAWPCALCNHPGRVHDDGDFPTPPPNCLWCAERAARLRSESYPWAEWRQAAADSRHDYAPRRRP